MKMESQEEETSGNNTLSTSEPQCKELAIGTYEHPCQLPQEQCKTSDYLSKNQEKEAGDTESKTVLEEIVLTSNIKDKLERRMMKVLRMYRCIRTASNTAGQSTECDKYASDLIEKLDGINSYASNFDQEAERNGVNASGYD